MGEPPLRTPQSEDRLDSWTEISRPTSNATLGRFSVWDKREESARSTVYLHDQDWLSVIRTLGSRLVDLWITFWMRSQESSISGRSAYEGPNTGQRRRALSGRVAEFDWPRDASRLACHTPGPRVPLFASSGNLRPAIGAIHLASNCGDSLETCRPFGRPTRHSSPRSRSSLPGKFDI